MAAHWIWLPKDIYPQHQTTKFDHMIDKSSATFVVAEFTKTYVFDQDMASVSITFSADTEVQLFCNEQPIATGPAAVGGDFFGNGKARQWYYASQTSFAPYGSKLAFFARVKMCPSRMFDYSMGHGGFMLDATVTFADGSQETITTDSTWLVRKNGAYVKPCSYDGRIAPDAYVFAEEICDIWNATIAPIPVREEKEVTVGRISLNPGEEIQKEFDLDLIYAGLIHLKSQGAGTVCGALTMKEISEDRAIHEDVVLQGQDEYRSFHLDSAGHISATFQNLSDQPCIIDISLITTYYPITVGAKTTLSDPDLEAVLEVCKSTLKYCRQTIHLDSPRHCEPLACTGDYYIEALMTAFSFGDMRLAEFDITRTAELLRHNDGRMFHTTYSLIWVRMLYDVYMFSGNFALLQSCRDALDLLLARFATYVGKSGIIENPPDYMFVDWIYLDDFSMHHPPRALGQTVLNMFYYMALDYAQRIYGLLGHSEASDRCDIRKRSLQTAINTLLYDKEKGMYFEGTNQPIAPEAVYEWQPQNVEKRYYLKHSNILAAYTSVCDSDTAVNLIHKIMHDEIEGNVQPYFLHYLLEAIYTHGLREKYTLAVIDRWKPAVKECTKGLVEGFISPGPEYDFDHSHAWGGTPLYSLPKALTGLSILEPGYKKIQFVPSLLSLNHATVEIPTPYGMITCEMKQREQPKITAPKEITIVI